MGCGRRRWSGGRGGHRARKRRTSRPGFATLFLLVGRPLAFRKGFMATVVQTTSSDALNSESGDRGRVKGADEDC